MPFLIPEEQIGKIQQTDTRFGQNFLNRGSVVEEIMFDRIDQCNEFLKTVCTSSKKPEVIAEAISLNEDVEDEISIKGVFSVELLPKIYEFLRKKQRSNNDR